MKEKEYAIKYKTEKITKDKYLLIPVELCEGNSNEEYFETDKKEKLPIAENATALKSKYVIDRIFDIEELEIMYEFESDGTNFLPDYFFENFKNTIMLVEADQENDLVKKNEFNLKDFTERELDGTFFMEKNNPVAAINQDYLNELLEEEDIKKLKVLLNKIKNHMEYFRTFHDKKGVTKVKIENGKVAGVELARKVDRVQSTKETPKSKPKDNVKDDISYDGLRTYIKERVFGHDEEIDTIAKILYLNQTVQKEDGVESILITGPTGVGKTETIKAASEYLDIPYMEVNAANIVPQGIKGMSIEDVLSNLYIRAGYDLEKAQRGFVFLDEFDKLNDSDLEIKGAVKNILLTYTQGGIFPIDNDQFTISFDTYMLNKAFGGVFDKTREKKKQIGFAKKEQTESKKTEKELRNKIIEKGYFTQEELSRINTIIEYKDLDRETRKRILLYSKLSELHKKRNRYKRDYGIDIIADDSYIEALLDMIEQKEEGMRVVNNLVKNSLDPAEKEILLRPNSYKKLVLTKYTVQNPKEFKIA